MLFIALDFLVVFFIVVDSHSVVRHFVGGSEFGGDFAVKGGKVRFELFQLVLFAPLLGDDGFELGNIGFEFGCPFLVLGDDAGQAA